MSQAVLQPRPAVQRMLEYSPPTGGREGRLRLDFNENTVGCSPAVEVFLRQRLSGEYLATYPEYAAARSVLADHFGVAENELLLTNGTDEAVQLLINTFVDREDEVIIPHPSYAMYRFYTELGGARPRMVPYQPATLAFPFEALVAAINSRTRAVFLSNPNNPTGTAIPVKLIREIAERAPGALILVDEAYYEFSGITALPELGKLNNLFVCRTFSKAYGMAGLRMGCLFSRSDNLLFVRKAQSPYSVNTLAVLAAQAAVGDREYVNHYVEEVLSAREMFCQHLTNRGVKFFESQANFVLLQLGHRALPVRDALRLEGILVRDRSYEMEGCVRVTIGTREQMTRLIEALDRLLDSSPSIGP